MRQRMTGGEEGFTASGARGRGRTRPHGTVEAIGAVTHLLRGTRHPATRAPHECRRARTRRSTPGGWQRRSGAPVCRAAGDGRPTAGRASLGRPRPRTLVTTAMGRLLHVAVGEGRPVAHTCSERVEGDPSYRREDRPGLNRRHSMGITARPSGGLRHPDARGRGRERRNYAGPISERRRRTGGTEAHGIGAT